MGVVPRIEHREDGLMGDERAEGRVGGGWRRGGGNQCRKRAGTYLPVLSALIWDDLFLSAVDVSELRETRGIVAV